MGTKISEFSNGTLPLAGTELVPIVQGGSTVKTTASAFSALAPVQSVAGRTGAVTLSTTDISGFTAAAAAAAPVQTVAGRTGAVTLGISDVASLQTSLDGKLNTSGGVISVNSSTDALRITQTGTGNALVVEDSANPDASPFVVTADGSVGIGTSSVTANVKLEVAGRVQATTDNPDFRSMTASGRGWRIGNESAGTTLGAFYIQGSSDGFVSNFVTPLYLSTSGNVGIGTSAPRSKLDLSFGVIAGVANIRGQANSGAYSIWGGLGTDSITDGGYVAFFGSTHATAANLVNFGNSVVGETMRIASNGFVGIGTSAPGRLLALSGTNATLGITSTAAGGGTVAIDPPSTAAAGVAQLDISGANSFRINTNSTERMRFDSLGNVGIGTAVFGTNANRTLGLANGTAPTTSPAGMGQIYVEAGALKYRGSSGTVTTIANA